MMIEGLDYNVQLISFPNNKVKEAVAPNADGTFTIFINSSLTREQRQNSLFHALKHIAGNDFYKEDIEKIEKEAHQI